MKKLNITKKQFGESKYFTNKYGTLKYVSENGKFYRTSKGHVLKFANESCNETDRDGNSIYHGKYRTCYTCENYAGDGVSAMMCRCNLNGKDEVVFAHPGMGRKAKPCFKSSSNAGINESSGFVTCDGCGDEVYEGDTKYINGQVLCKSCANEIVDESLGGGRIAKLIKFSGMNEEVIDEKPVDDEMEAAEMYANYVADHEEDDSFQYDELINSPNAQDEIIHIAEVIHKRGEYENEFLDGGYILQVKMIDEMDESWLGDKLGAAGRAVGKAAGDVVSGAGKLAWKGAKTVGKAAGKGAMKAGKAVGKAAGKAAIATGKAAGKAVGAAATATGKAAVKAGKKVIDKVKGNNSGDLKKGDDVVIQNKDGTKVVGTVLGYDKVDKIYSVQDNEENEPSGDTNKKSSEMNNKEDKDLTKNKDTGTLNKQKKQAAESRIIKIKHVETIVFNESSQYDEGLKDALSAGWKKVKDGAKSVGNAVKDGAKKLGKKIGDVFNGPFRTGDHVEMTGDNGETVKGTITGFDLGDKTYTVLLGNNYDEGSDDSFDRMDIESKLRDIEEDPTTDDIIGVLGELVDVKLDDEGIYDGNGEGGYVMYRDFVIKMDGHIINAKYYYDRDSGEVGEVEIDIR